jgi:hypothetical protein
VQEFLAGLPRKFIVNRLQDASRHRCTIARTHHTPHQSRYHI